ncbi:MAG TPA: TrbC/VirB2 family protein [Acetobacteraceae bacterium]|nr:TrbC/VirB2 family protein [Acetobacteraceae bacterium]
MTIHQRRATALAIALSLAPVAAHAQAIGGGGGGLLSGVVNWLQGSVITNIAVLAIIAVGASLFFLRFHFVTIVAVCAGIWIMFNANTILGYLQ